MPMFRQGSVGHVVTGELPPLSAVRTSATWGAAVDGTNYKSGTAYFYTGAVGTNGTVTMTLQRAVNSGATSFAAFTTAVTAATTVANTLTATDFEFDAGFPFVRMALVATTSVLSAGWIALDTPTRTT